MTQGLQKFVCHKQVNAARIVDIVIGSTSCQLLVEGEGVKLVELSKDMKWFERHSPRHGDYLVVYEDGYTSVSPSGVFENGYSPAASGFGWAIAAIKAGKRVQREGWNGKGMFLFLVPGSTFLVSRPPLLGIYPEGTSIEYHAHIDMKTAQGYVVPWLASQADMLANDWVEFSEGEAA